MENYIQVEDRQRNFPESRTLLQKLSAAFHIFKWGTTEEEDYLLADRNAFLSKVAKLKSVIKEKDRILKCAENRLETIQYCSKDAWDSKLTRQRIANALKYK